MKKVNEQELYVLRGKRLRFMRAIEEDDGKLRLRYLDNFGSFVLDRETSEVMLSSGALSVISPDQIRHAHVFLFGDDTEDRK